MKRREALLTLIAGAVVVLALLTVFAIELANTQAQSKQDVKARMHEGAVLGAALIDGLYQSAEYFVPQYTRDYGGPVVPARELDATAVQRGGYLAVVDDMGRVLAASSGFTAQARADVAHSTAVALVRTGRPYELGDLQPYGRTGAALWAVAFPTRYGRRILVTGNTPSVLSAFVVGDLRKIPGVSGAYNYLLDGRNAVLGSSDPAVHAGKAITRPGAVRQLKRRSGDVGGEYFEQVPLANSTWRIVVAAPDGPLFASVSGLHKWVPWIIFVAFALAALGALMLGRRVLESAEEVRLANARLRGVNRELERSNSDLEHFASIASHDLREPLRKVRTFTQRVTAMESRNLSPKGHEYLQRANAAAARMQVLIEDLLHFSRVATHQRPLAEIDLDHVTRAVLRDLSDEVARSGASVHIGDLPTICGDPVQLRQLMQNLISNALKFRRPEVDHEVTIEASGDGDMLQLIVHDNGIGFGSQYSERIFGVFERLHGRSAYPGTGIGLALCRKIAERHGGTIVADGVPGEGATFRVKLPLGVAADPSVDGHRETSEAHVAP